MDSKKKYEVKGGIICHSQNILKGREKSGLRCGRTTTKIRELEQKHECFMTEQIIEKSQRWIT